MTSHREQQIVRALFIFSILTPLLCQDKKIVRFTNIERLEPGSFEKFIEQPTITAVYFMLKGKSFFFYLSTKL